jgi:lipopolysaccharide/colanic/teichoic acid biosynthesis glycosyltransferase
LERETMTVATEKITNGKRQGWVSLPVLLPGKYRGSETGELLSWPVSKGYLAVKRLVDVLLAGVGLAVSLPILFLAGLAIKLNSRGPVLFKQERAGHQGKPFTIYKLRTMVSDQKDDIFYGQAEGRNGPAFKLKHDPRITWVGRWLRRTSIDELPQLVNVLLGQMTLVGPRPLPLDQVKLERMEERARLSVKPGLTGLWQVSGRADVPYEEWVEMDLYYVQHQSLWVDFLILMRTIPAVLSCRGAY